MAELRDTFRFFARDVAAQGSPLYALLCARLAEDPERASIVLHAEPAFQTPLILLAAVHHLLRSEADGALRAYYATLSGDATRPVDEEAYPTFAAFVDAHRSDIEELVASHSTQTNEVGRTVVTLPALGLVAARAVRPLAVLEVGASAGLNLLIDRFGFRIGSLAAGEPSSPVQLECAVDGKLSPPVPERLDIAWRLGVDLHPLDARDPDTRAWLRALVWPEHLDRMSRLEAALELAQQDPPMVVPGDLTRDLAELAARVPQGTVLAIVSTWTLAYVTGELRGAFAAELQDIARARGRDVWLVAGEGQGVLTSLGLGLVEPPDDGTGGPSMLAMCRFAADGTTDCRLLAECHAHGRWIRWLDRASAADAGSRGAPA